MDITPARRNWTFLFYMNGDNDLREHTSLDFVRLQQGGCPEDSAIVAQVYRGEERWSWKNLGQKLADLASPALPSAFQQDWRGCKTFVIDPQGCRELSGPGRALPSQPQALQEFIERGLREYPAENYALVIDSHGYGAAGLLRDGDGRSMKLEDFRQSIERSGVKLQLLVLQACQMGQPAALAGLAGCADYLLTSPQKIPAGQARYDQLLPKLNGQDAAGVADAFHQSFHETMPGFELHQP
ncbi:MAG: hypothetical protein KF760_23215 [Candidatus Eremiobacteraeota bacterium]|nr:hypothetical protein [Candidatus Eremiobacteraeota bacterium]MCW5870528.1 hypothetical protein [Candidatus Eremiobacteraeota bacterium]